MHSSKFRRELASRAPGAAAVEEIVIRDLKAIDFERMVSVLLPSVPGQLELTSIEEWISVLHVAHTWEFPRIKTLALSQIEPIASAVDKVVIGREHALPRWTAAGYLVLCQRESPISRDEGRRLGVDTVTDISILRHSLHGASGIRVDEESVRGLLMPSLPDTLQDNFVACLLRTSLFDPGDTSEGSQLGDSRDQSEESETGDEESEEEDESRGSGTRYRYRFLSRPSSPLSYIPDTSNLEDLRSSPLPLATPRRDSLYDGGPARSIIALCADTR